MKTLATSLLAAGMMVSALGAADVSKIDLTTSYDAGKYFNYATPDLSVSMYAYSSGTYTPLQNLPRNTYEIYSREGMISTPVSVTFFLTPRFNATFSNTEDFVELVKTKVRITGNQNLFTFPESLAIPADTAPGHYYLGIKVDSDNVYAEINEHNNMTNYMLEVDERAPHISSFVVSQMSSSWTDPAAQEQSCVDAFGEGARVASWSDIERFVRDGGDASELSSKISLSSWSLFINHEGEAMSSSGGKYMISKGNPKLKLQSAIDSVQNHTIDLKTVNATWIFQNGTYHNTLCISPISFIAVDYSNEVDPL